MTELNQDRGKSILRQFLHSPGKTLGTAFSRIKHRADRRLKQARRNRIRRSTAVQDNEIVIMTNTCTYTCNPKYIDQEIRRRKLPVHVTWIVDDKNKKKDYPEGTDFVRLYTDACTRAVYSAKVWIDNGIAFSNHFDKKPEQIHIQTMHGSLGIKKLDNAVLSRNQRGKSGQLVVQRETRNTDYVLTNSAFEEGVFRRVFWKDTPMLRLGHARTDILFCEDRSVTRGIREKLEKEYGIPQDRKLVLYAPTHRRGMTLEDMITDYTRLNEVMAQRWGGEFATLLRLHSRTKDIFLNISEIPNAYDVTKYPDIQELMLVADVGITDYSSWIFDFVLTRKPGFLYATDQDRYDNRTGLAYPLEETPFPVSSSFDELLDQIRAFDKDHDYQQKVEAFLAGKEAVDDGHSAERIVTWLVELMKIPNEIAE